MSSSSLTPTKTETSSWVTHLRPWPLECLVLHIRSLQASGRCGRRHPSWIKGVPHSPHQAPSSKPCSRPGSKLPSFLRRQALLILVRRRSWLEFTKAIQLPRTHLLTILHSSTSRSHVTSMKEVRLTLATRSDKYPDDTRGNSGSAFTKMAKNWARTRHASSSTWMSYLRSTTSVKKEEVMRLH